ncbi:J-binding protein [Trypanosoma cruzi]|uniref:Thymine dioxygenase JBP1-A n=2 Tax=Trypanosoma cruzi TaxID=5693 RepID=JBP1A_TRYCC|nr:DnaJ chaperone protein, putative [Trypanosoma cruzi]Q4DBW3.1 RecName: Full=Thymine dioxygenase JBP1-A; AltName: Full=J-binding protein 1A; AltName: Full=Thymidine hydroxylase JBP1-A [Trypanosoma cruzi strain CL Brener]EAN90000.1 DnaJ chaperone protein, putative [Trypanosoma cruzi]PWV21123.1 J-binding protein [Trypanosoma cruzi]|eukprot:XP_811851.1 DnaJ chaperone protein [Trypanosoma cruzi strain CL Brener]
MKQKRGKQDVKMLESAPPQLLPKKGRLEISELAPQQRTIRTAEEIETAYNEAVRKHPFYDNADHTIDFHDATVFRDARGVVGGVFLPGALPAFAATMAADVLRPAAVRTSLRSNMFGGFAPLSGIAGYFDYRGSPVELKCRKTSFTYENVHSWPNVFPMIDYVSAIYKAVFPEQWAAQDAAVPDIVRIHGSPFSTLTVNQQFRTASHTDAGDFDMGYGLLAVLEGKFEGLSLALDDFGVCFRMQPRDILIFNTHFFHSNTEPELNHPRDDWSRLTCVCYYRAALGEPACVAEYERRLARAKEIGASPPPAVDAILQKDNGNNFNKPAPTFPYLLTPFGGAASVCSLHCCTAKLLRLHELLLENPTLEVILFGESLRTDDGLPRREKEQLISVHLPVVVKMSPSGGFSELGGALKAAEEKQYFFEEKYLADELGPDLMSMWTQSRAHWLRLVKEDWERLCRRDPERTKFTWNNSSAMNAAFFDLCEVAKQMMIGLLNKETPSSAENHSFWILFAAHLNYACTTENGMPRDAVGMHKLNVKLKDFHFGGTRYLKDMPPEEQERRLERKKRIEEARRRGSSAHETHTDNWLLNDTFDYQQEDRKVEFEENGWMTPEAYVKHLGLKPCGDVTAAASPTEPIHVLVVLPRPAAAATAKDAKRDVPLATSEESIRLLMNPAAQRVLRGKARNVALPSPLSFGGVKITVLFDGDDIDCIHPDFVILQHLLATIEEDEAAKARVKYWARVARYCVFVVETDVRDRRHFLLREEVRVAYEDVAEDCFRSLHAAAYSTKYNRLRTTPSLIALCNRKNIGLRFKFRGSPLNTIALVVVGERLD